VNNKSTLAVAFQDEHVSYVTPMNDTIPATLLNEEEEIKEVSEDGANEGSEEEEWDDDYEDTEDEIDVHLKDSDEDNKIEDDD